MRHIMLAFCTLFFVSPANAQTRPVISFDNIISAKLDTIKPGMNDLVKTFGKNSYKSGSYKTKYNTDFKVGKGMMFLSEDEYNQTMQLDFSSIYYDGTNDLFVKFYEDIIKKVTEMLLATHSRQPEERKENHYQTIFYEKGKNVSDSPTSVFILYDAYSGKFPTVSIYFYRKNK